MWIQSWLQLPTSRSSLGTQSSRQRPTSNHHLCSRLCPRPYFTNTPIPILLDISLRVAPLRTTLHRPSPLLYWSCIRGRTTLLGNIELAQDINMIWEGSHNRRTDKGQTVRQGNKTTNRNIFITSVILYKVQHFFLTLYRETYNTPSVPRGVQCQHCIFGVDMEKRDGVQPVTDIPPTGGQRKTWEAEFLEAKSISKEGYHAMNLLKGSYRVQYMKILK